MKKLFAIKEVATGKVLKDKDFEVKTLAKEERKKLNGKTKEGQEILSYVVTLGIDHKDYILESGKTKRGTLPKMRKKVIEEDSADVRDTENLLASLEEPIAG